MNRERSGLRPLGESGDATHMSDDVEATNLFRSSLMCVASPLPPNRGALRPDALTHHRRI